MHTNRFLILLIILFTVFCDKSIAQQSFSRVDTLRGSITNERAWWDVKRYDIIVEPNFSDKSIRGQVDLLYQVISPNGKTPLQIDLKNPLTIDSILLNNHRVEYTRVLQSYHVHVPDQKKNNRHTLQIYYSGKVVEAVNPPWQGGWIFTKDTLNRDWVTVTSHGSAGSSIWFPSKDHQGDEPDKGVSLTMIVPDTLVAVSNGRLVDVSNLSNNTTSYKWEVKNTINSYSITPYIGKYVNIQESYPGEKGKLDLSYWVLDYNRDVAKIYFSNEVKPMLAAYEHWFGAYPFYEDSYKLIDVPYAGMEHQSAIAYGNNYASGYSGRSTVQKNSHAKWDFIIVHESAHEWFGNSITVADLADMWVPEGFATYGETLYVEYLYGEESAHEYTLLSRAYILNDKPVIPDYNVNAQGSTDLYTKAANMIHSIRNSINNTERFRRILKGITSKYYHNITSGEEIERYISTMAGFDYKHVFNQYLRTVDIPQFEYKIDREKNTVSFKYSKSIPDFNLPLVLTSKDANLKILPKTTWTTLRLSAPEISLFNKLAIEKKYFVEAVEIKN